MKTKLQKRAEAIERTARWQGMTPKEQLRELDRRGLVAKRQRERIEKQLSTPRQ